MPRKQRTVRQHAELRGVGLHEGVEARLRVGPASVGSGVTFVRSDLPNRPRIPARVAHLTERERRTERAMALMASFWWMTTLDRASSIWSRRSASAFSRRVSGMPVIFETVSAITSASTSPVSSLEACSARHSFWTSSFFLRSW